ncbi:helix-turn-helix transcriptional regulator [Paenibacillus thailandensis]|uniref:Helix-turn-helix transcriptional regulator n=1 Tax=Paenibacillus thailandensis TaxID=393250 RepID=A0ABW5R4W3_9BACL
MALERGECRLREKRLAAKMTQQELSDKIFKNFGLEVSAQMIGHIENNRKGMNVLLLRACARIFKCHMDDFYTWPIT